MSTISPNEKYSAQVIRDREGLLELQTEWNALLERSSADCIFLRWEWIAAWLDALSQSPDLFVLTVRSADGQLRGIAPYYVVGYVLLGHLPVRVLRVLAEQDTGGEYGDWIVDQTESATWRAAIAEGLASNAKAWELVSMPRMKGWSESIAEIEASCRAAGLRLAQRKTSFSAARLPPSFDAYMAEFSANRRQQLRRTGRKVLSHGRRIVRCDSPGVLSTMLTALFELHARRWNERGEAGTFNRNPTARRFFEIYTPKAMEEGTLRLYALERNGEIEAVQLGYAYAGTFHQMQEGFDPEIEPGLGNALRLEVFRCCIDEGLACYDFLGGHTEHKRRWQSVERNGYQLLIAAPKLMSRLLLQAKVWPRGRFLREQHMVV